jgi:hypothetical protein
VVASFYQADGLEDQVEGLDTLIAKVGLDFDIVLG